MRSSTYAIRAVGWRLVLAIRAEARQEQAQQELRKPQTTESTAPRADA